METYFFRAFIPRGMLAMAALGLLPLLECRDFLEASTDPTNVTLDLVLSFLCWTCTLINTTDLY